MDKFSDECGIVGVVLKSGKNAAQMAYYGLNGIQHRGQESAGLAVMSEGQISCFKDTGLVTEVFDEKILSLLNSGVALGHVNHFRDSIGFNTSSQPFVINYGESSIAVSYNGGLINGRKIRRELGAQGAIFTTNSDAETIAICLARNDKGDFPQAIVDTMKQLRGGYAFAVLKDEKIYAARDPFSIRPLAVGSVEDGYLLASESCAIELMGGELVRDLVSGEVVEVSKEGIKSHHSSKEQKRASCVFEHVYFARPDSTIDNINVFISREQAGKSLAQESPAEADLVVGVPDSGTPAATGFAAESGIPYSSCMIKNKYIGRTYIISNDKEREMNVRIKLNPVRQIIEGKRIVLVDDSIVRGTTMRNIISNIRSLGALEVHLRISSPPVLNSCYFGVETPEEKDLIANNLSRTELAKSLGADSLEYLSIDGLIKSVGNNKENYCTACFSGDYPDILEVQE